LEQNARVNGPGRNYLIQHSAGSGKSNSIGWLAHRLAFLHNAEDQKVFDSVVVITDRVILEQKTEVMIEHFRAHTRHKIGGKAKAMVVTSSRLHAVGYKQAFDRYIAEHGYEDLSTLVAFSGSVIDDLDPNVTYTEGSMNQGISDREIPKEFETEEYQVLIAADKFQTGFDQPLLHTMYVDSLRKFAQLADVSPTYLSQAEQGNVAPPTADRVKRMAELLEANVDEWIALAGRVPEDLPEIIQRNPTAIPELLWEANGLAAEQLKKLIERARKMKAKRG